MSQEPLYLVRDAAGATYGPAAMPMLRQWIAEGRITANMQVAPQGTLDFRSAGELPELASAFTPAAAAAAPAAATSSPPSFSQSATAQYPYPVYTKSSGLAIASLVCSLCGPLFCGVPAIVGIILGHMARGQIRREPDRYDGMGLATAGTIIGYCMVALVFLGIVAYILFIVAMVSSSSSFR